MSAPDELGKLRRRCDVCGALLVHPQGPGRPRRYCGGECAELARLAKKRGEPVPRHRAAPL